MTQQLLQDERDEHVHLVTRDLALLDPDLLLLDPCAPDVAERLVGTRDALFDGILETDRGRGADFRDLRNVLHSTSSEPADLAPSGHRITLRRGLSLHWYWRR